MCPFSTHSNVNFPAPVSVLAFIGAVGGIVFASLSAATAAFLGKGRLVRWIGYVAGTGIVLYTLMLAGLSLASRDQILSRGQEKYFCEIDCHIAYSVEGVKIERGASLPRYTVRVRTYFDPQTISARRPRGAPLTPDPREVYLVDAAGHRYPVAAQQGTPLLTALAPGDAYSTDLVFEGPADPSGTRLLLLTEKRWEQNLLIGHENSWLHRKTYLAL